MSGSNSASGDSGWRTTWSNGLHVGKGFHREVGVIAATAIKYNNQEEPAWTSRVSGSVKVVSSSSEYARTVAAGGSVSMEGWGASAEASAKMIDKVAINTSNVTGMVSMCYLSEQIDMVNPTNEDHGVVLMPSAANLLETQGPEKFHALYGSHFVSGYTKGGYFHGRFVMEFASSNSAKSNEASLKASFEGYGLKAGGSAEFLSKVDKIQEVTSYYGGYDCEGWSANHPPKLICSLDDLAAAHNGFEIKNGRKMEAILRRYTDIDSYAASRAKYYESQGKEDVYDEVSILEENYGAVSRALNIEYLRYDYLCRLLRDATAAAQVDIRTKAQAKMDAIEAKFRGTPSTMDKVRQNFKGLEVFLVAYDGNPKAIVEPDDKANFDVGLKLHEELWQAGTLEASLKPALVASGGETTVAKSVGNNWSMDTSDGHLRIKYKGNQKMVLHKPQGSTPGRLWTEESQYYNDRFVKYDEKITIRSNRNGNRLQHSNRDSHAAFDNGNRGEWEGMMLIKTG